MRITLQDSRQLTGQLMAYDRHMNLVLADTEEFRKIKRKQTAGKTGGASSSDGQTQTVVQEEKRTLGLMIVRGAHIVSLSVESPPPADPSARLGKTAPGGVGAGVVSAMATGPGVARAAGRGQAAPISLAGPAAGVGPGVGPGMGVGPGAPGGPPAPFPGFPGAPGFPGRGGRKLPPSVPPCAHDPKSRYTDMLDSCSPWLPRRFPSCWFPRWCSGIPWRSWFPSWWRTPVWIQPSPSALRDAEKFGIHEQLCFTDTRRYGLLEIMG